MKLMRFKNRSHWRPFCRRKPHIMSSFLICVVYLLQKNGQWGSYVTKNVEWEVFHKIYTTLCRCYFPSYLSICYHLSGRLFGMADNMRDRNIIFFQSTIEFIEDKMHILKTNAPPTNPGNHFSLSPCLVIPNLAPKMIILRTKMHESIKILRTTEWKTWWLHTCIIPSVFFKVIKPSLVEMGLGSLNLACGSWKRTVSDVININLTRHLYCNYLEHFEAFSQFRNFNVAVLHYFAIIVK